MTALSAGLIAMITGLAVPAGAVPVRAGQAPEAVCRVTDKRLVEISGLVAEGAGYVVVNDGADAEAGRRIFFLNRNCKVARTVSFPSRPRDTEDLARGGDGTLWVGDVGDNGQNRDTVGVWRLPPGSRSPKLFRMTYPDGAHDAEALLVTGDGTPVVVTKDPLTAGVYVPDGPLRDGSATPLRRAGSFRIPLTGTDNPFGFRGRLVVTGGAVSPDGRRVVLRTYADAFEFDVPAGAATADGVVRAITEGTARTVALPGEPQGESISYTADGRALLTVSEMTGSATEAPLLRYPLPEGSSPAPVPATSPATTAPKAASSSPQAPAAAASRAPDSGLPVGAVVAGLGLVAAAGAIGVAVARRRRQGS
jgi:hypothetical protein